MKMSDTVLPHTPLLYHKIEDSGYNTFSSKTLDCTSDLDPSNLSLQSSSKRCRFKGVYASASPNDRRGVKRTYHEECFATPTREISHEIQKLYVNENFSSNLQIPTFIEFEQNTIQVFPTTPVKTCKENCQVSPYKKGKKLNFNVHSIKCEINESSSPKLLEKQVENWPPTTRSFRPDERFNLIKVLITKKIFPPVIKIMNYLSDKDVYSLSLACARTWSKICDIVYNAEKRRNAYLKVAKKAIENQENENQNISMKACINSRNRSLKVINNNKIMFHSNSIDTIRDERSVSLEKILSPDQSSMRIICVLCCHPAKVVHEANGEHWAKCTKITCSYQFCKMCKCQRHPGRKCIQYDLEGPSPSKRKKVWPTNCIGTKKSKRMLLRL